MGALANCLAQAKTFSAGSPLGRWLQTEINRLSVDEAVPTGAAAADSVFTIDTDTVDHTGGDFTLTATIRQADGSEETFTTAAIAYNANAATIEGAIDTAATSASITGWTNADISVAAQNTDLQDGWVNMTCDGTSVTERPVTWVLTDSRTGGTSGATAQSAEGQLERPALAVLMNYGVIVKGGTPGDEVGALPGQGDASSTTGFTKGTGSESQRMPKAIQKALMREAAFEDSNNGTGISLEAVLAPQDKAPIVQPRTDQDGLTRSFDV